jgi:aromatic ring-cleaving dioxygenase
MTIGTELVMADSGFDCTAVVADAATNLPPSAFDYGGIPADAVAKLRNIAATIKRTTADTIILIGNHLNDAKDLIDHGSFIAWLEQAVGMNKRTAQDYMAAARFVRGKSATVALLPPKVLYALAAKSTSPEIVTDVVTRVDRGEIVTQDDISHMKSVAGQLQKQDQKRADNNFRRTNAGRARAAALEAKSRQEEMAARHRARVLAEEVISTYGITTVNAILKAFHAEIYFEDAVRQLASPVEGRTKPPVVIVAKPADAAMAKSRRVVPLSSDRIRAIADRWRNDIDADAVSGDPAIRTVRAPRPVRTEMVGQA